MILTRDSVIRPTRRDPPEERCTPNSATSSISPAPSDGGRQFTVQELATAARLQLPLPIVVFANGGYGEIRDEMRARARGDVPATVDLPPVDLPALARAYGGHGTRACGPAAPAPALTAAPDRPGPTLITVPEETP
ncbi:thiamine pyrophosphate-dependent enzyme [Streptomyces sp. NPDC002521]